MTVSALFETPKCHSLRHETDTASEGACDARRESGLPGVVILGYTGYAATPCGKFPCTACFQSRGGRLLADKVIGGIRP